MPEFRDLSGGGNVVTLDENSSIVPLRTVVLTQAEYDDIDTPDPTVVYLIKEA
jgi:hypothetical protein